MINSQWNSLRIRIVTTIRMEYFLKELLEEFSETLLMVLPEELLEGYPVEYKRNPIKKYPAKFLGDS